MSGGQAVVFEGLLYYQGAKVTISANLNTIYRYNIRVQQWISAIKHPTRHFSIGQVSGKLVSVGGRSEQNIVSGKMYYYNKSEGEWINRKPMPTARALPTVISQPTCLIVAGGLASLTSAYCYDCTNVVEIFSTNTKRWTRVESMPIACGFMSGGVSNGMVYLIGGEDKANRFHKTYIAPIDKLLCKITSGPSMQDLSSSLSQDEPLWIEATNTPAYSSAALVISGMVFALGGVVSAEHSALADQGVKNIYVYSASMNSWIHVGELPVPLSEACAVATSPVEFFVIGGIEDGAIMCTVYKGVAKYGFN